MSIFLSIHPLLTLNLVNVGDITNVRFGGSESDDGGLELSTLRSPLESAVASITPFSTSGESIEENGIWIGGDCYGNEKRKGKKNV